MRIHSIVTPWLAAFAVLALSTAHAQDAATPPAAQAPTSAAVAAPVVVADIAPPAADRAQIVFLKPGRGPVANLPVGIFEIEGDARRLQGILDADARIAVDVAPGHHRFMSHTFGITHFLEVDVEAGKRYFVLARFVYANGFQLRPIHPGAAGDYDAGRPEFAQWLAGTTVKPDNAPQRAWYAKHDDKVAKAQAKGQETWSRKTDAERAELTLRAADAL
jgi:hypothetical protein